MKRAHAMLLAASLAACGNSSVIGNLDASVVGDAPTVDTPSTDLAAPPDAPVADVGPPDAGPADAPSVDVSMDAGPRCATTQTVCDGACVDLAEDRAHCGRCGNACMGMNVCVAGACRASCLPGETRCDGRCVRTDADPAHCGGCDMACAAGQVCVAGRCGTACDSPGSMVVECRPSELERYCADVRSDRRNCGSCGARCLAGEVCEDGRCASPCPEGQRRCEGRCVDTAADNAHCGACANVCAAGTRTPPRRSARRGSTARRTRRSGRCRS